MFAEMLLIGSVAINAEGVQIELCIFQVFTI